MALAALAAVAGSATMYLSFPGSDNTAGPGLRSKPVASAAPGASAMAQTAPLNGLAAYAKGAVAAFVARPEPVAVPAIAMQDGDAKPLALEDWQGKIVLLNLWATWCAPCLKEMPALDRLKAALGGADFDVIALNIDKGSTEKPKKFLSDAGITSLTFMRDPTAKAFAVIQSAGMPTTLLIGRDGRELGRLVGPAEWDLDEAKALVRAAIAR